MIATTNEHELVLVEQLRDEVDELLRERGALLRDRAQVAREFQLLHTLVHGLAVADALVLAGEQDVEAAARAAGGGRSRQGAALEAPRRCPGAMNG